MLGIHTYTLHPFYARYGKEAKYTMGEVHRVVLEISVRAWKKYNGETKLYADSRFAEYLDKQNMLKLWDTVNTEVCDKLPAKINFNVFWAAPKLYAIRNEQIPFVSVDWDLFITKPLPEYFEGDISILHREMQNANVYPSPCWWGYDKEFDDNCKPINAALTYFGNMDLKNEYANEAIRIIEKESKAPKYYIDDPLVKMCFAEQWLLAYILKKREIEPKTLIHDIFTGNKNLVWQKNGKPSNINEVRKYLWHTWGDKKMIDSDPRTEAKYLSYLQKQLSKLIN